MTDIAPPFKNAPTAPFIFFDFAPAYGVLGGAIQVELAARTLIPDPNGTDVATEVIPTAHLRCSPIAAGFLRDALTAALEMLTKLQEPSAASAMGKLN